MKNANSNPPDRKPGKRKNMKAVEKRIRGLEELVFRVILEIKAENLAIRDILVENNLVSSDRWDDLVERHKTSFESFKKVSAVEGGYEAPQGSGVRDQGSEKEPGGLSEKTENPSQGSTEGHQRSGDRGLGSGESDTAVQGSADRDQEKPDGI
jgi:hypothetical protein